MDCVNNFISKHAHATLMNKEDIGGHFPSLAIRSQPRDVTRQRSEEHVASDIKQLPFLHTIQYLEIYTTCVSIGMDQ